MDHAEIMRRANETIAEAHLKYGGPAPPLTEDELDRSETELHYFLMRGPPKKEQD